jgi:hypothetical protein
MPKIFLTTTASVTMMAAATRDKDAIHPVMLVNALMA